MRHLSEELLYGELQETLPDIMAGGCKFSCYTSRIKTKKSSEYYRLICKKVDKKCKPYTSTISPTILLPKTLKAEAIVNDSERTIDFTVWDDIQPIPDLALNEVQRVLQAVKFSPGGISTKDYQKYLLRITLSEFERLLLDLPTLKQILVIRNIFGIRQEEATFRDELRKRLKPLSVKSIEVWSKGGDLRVYITVRNSALSTKFIPYSPHYTGGVCDYEEVINVQAVLYVTGNQYNPPGKFEYLTTACGGSKKYPVYAMLNPEGYSRETIEDALGFKLDSEMMIKLQKIIV